MADLDGQGEIRFCDRCGAQLAGPGSTSSGRTGDHDDSCPKRKQEDA